jgi:[amino group carrier protein]-L-2-aminoadipate 6-kinase
MILVKAGGGAGLNWDGIAADLAALRGGTEIVLVHGANALRGELAARLGVPVRTVVSPSGISSVYTDKEALDIFLMAYAGLANKRIVARLQREGVNAVGLTGVDGRLWEAKPKKDLYVLEDGRTKLFRDNLTGRVEKANAGLIRLLLGGGYTPVVCAPAITAEGEIVNTDNDTAAAVLAAAMGIERIIYLFEAPGLLREADRPETLVPKVDRSAIQDCLPWAKGRMQKKIVAVQRALEAGVAEVVFGDGRTEHPVRDALDGKGTVFA